MTGKKLMILGAGVYQVPLILRAKEMGLETCVVSVVGDYPGISLADRFYALDTRDYESVLKVAQEENISGICTSGTDVAVQTIGYICGKMKLPGISWEAAQKVTDKWKMKTAFFQGGVATAQFYKVKTVKEVEMLAQSLGYPLMIKAVDSSGSRGIVRINRKEELSDACEQVKRVSKKEYFLVEEYIQADEIGVDGFVGTERIEAFFPHKKFTYKNEGVTVPIGHAFPYEMSMELYQELYRQISLAIQALNLKNCPFNADVFVKGNKVWIIEMGGRTGATCIPELISIYQNRNWYTQIIESSLGYPVDFRKKTFHPCMAKLLFSTRNGKIIQIDREKLDSLTQQGIYWQLDVQEGMQVEKLKNGTDRIGHVIVETDEEIQLDVYASKVRSCLWLEQGNLEELYEKDMQ